METEQTEQKRSITLLTFLAAGLSLASLAWTTWSINDLLDTGTVVIHEFRVSMGLTVALSLDVVWGSILYAEYRQVPLGGKLTIRGRTFTGQNVTTLIGWLSLAAVVVLLYAHGKSLDNTAMAWAGPLLPLGAKVVWTLEIAMRRDPDELTPTQRDQLAQERKDAEFARQQARHQEEEECRRHEDDMRRLKAQGEREEKEAELQRKRALAEQERLAKVEEAERSRRRRAKEAEIEDAKLNAELVRMQERADTEMRIERIQDEARENMALAEGDANVQEFILNKQRELGRRQSFIIGETVPPVQSQPALRPVPSAPKRPGVITMSVDGDGLTSAQQDKKNLAAAYWKAKEQNPLLSQKKFAEDNDVSTSQLNRAVNEFPKSYFEDSSEAI